jgi:hypothetical protein
LSLARNKTAFYSLVSFFMGVVFLFFVFVEFYDPSFSFSSWVWDAVFMVGLAVFFFAVGFYGLLLASKGRVAAGVESGESHELIKIAVAVLAFLVAVWIMFHFGVL